MKTESKIVSKHAGSPVGTGLRACFGSAGSLV